MATYEISRSFRWAGPVTDGAAQLCRMFGLTTDRLKSRTVTHACRVQINPGDIVYVTGPSGAGKSVLLRELERAIGSPESVNLAQIRLPEDRPVIDCFGDDAIVALKLLSAAGLSEVFCLLNRPCNLSDGEKYRFRLAQAMATGRQFIFADEFAADLDRVTAAVIAYNVHRFAKRTGTTFILASCHEDILMDLAPDVLVVKDPCGEAKVIYRSMISDL